MARCSEISRDAASSCLCTSPDPCPPAQLTVPSRFVCLLSQTVGPGLSMANEAARDGEACWMRTRVVPTPRVRLAVTARPAAHLLSTLEDIESIWVSHCPFNNTLSLSLCPFAFRFPPSGMEDADEQLHHPMCEATTTSTRSAPTSNLQAFWSCNRVPGPSKMENLNFNSSTANPPAITSVN